MPRFERWDLVSVPFPYVERPIQQRRPALVVDVVTGGPDELMWVLMVTAAANAPWPDDVAVAPSASTGLPIPSVVRTAKIATVAAADAQRLGKLPTKLATVVLGILIRRFGGAA